MTTVNEQYFETKRPGMNGSCLSDIIAIPQPSFERRSYGWRIRHPLTKEWIMERRMRPRVTPSMKAHAYLNGSAYPAKIIDYSASGLGVSMLANGLKAGSKVSVDLVINEELCACCIPGTVCWTCGSTAGIRLDNQNDHQVYRSREVETRLMCR